VAGATSGGAALVVRKRSGIQKPEIFMQESSLAADGKHADVALRAWLDRARHEVHRQRRSVQVIPLANPDQLTLFMKKELDGAGLPNLATR